MKKKRSGKNTHNIPQPYPEQWQLKILVLRKLCLQCNITQACTSGVYRHEVGLQDVGYRYVTATVKNSR